MGRKIKGYKPGDERLYIPEAFGNRKDTEPVKVWIKTPTERAKREIEGDRSMIRFSVDADGKPVTDSAGNPVMQIDNEESTRRHHLAVERFVVRVENYEGRGGVAITNGADLAEHGDTAIITELFQEIWSSLSLSVDESKKLEGSHSSCSAATQALHGTAENACATDKASGETATAAIPDSCTS